MDHTVVRELGAFTNEELIAELERRYDLRRKNLCSYCGQPFSETRDCKYHEKGWIITYKGPFPCVRVERVE